MSEQNNKSNSFSKAVSRAALLLGVFTLLGSLLIAFTHQNTEDKITQNRRAFILKNLNEVLPQEKDSIRFYDNDILVDSFELTDSDLGQEGIIIYPAYNNKQPVGAIITSIAANGYNGKIKMIVGIKDNNGKAQIISTRVVAHTETPGLGDPIETRRSDWIYQYDGKSLNNPNDSQWLVKKDGGDFDQLTGATITPRAVTQGIKRALLYYEANREHIFNQNKPKIANE